MLEGDTTNCTVCKQVLWSSGSENLKHIRTTLILSFFLFPWDTPREEVQSWYSKVSSGLHLITDVQLYPNQLL